MNESDYGARPFFRVLSGILAVLAWTTLFMFVSLDLLGDRSIWLRWAGYIGIASFGLTMTRTTIRKKRKVVT
jgi:hypothetical protein